MATNLFGAFLAGLGIFFIFLAFARVRISTPKGSARLAEMRRAELNRDAVIPDPYYGIGDFVKSWNKTGLDRALAQADLDVKRSQFIRTGLFLAAVGFAGTFALIGAPLTSAFAGLVTFLLYVRWLFHRRDKMTLAYEDALADAAATMATGAQMGGGTLHSALAHAANHAPEIIQSDLDFISKAMIQGESFEEACKPVQQRRQSAMLNMLVKTLGGWSLHGADRSLGDVLAPLTETIRDTSATRRRQEAEMSSQRMQMQLLAIAPLGLATLMRISSPAYARIYGSFAGEVTLIVAFSLSLFGVVLGERFMGEVNQMLNIGGEV